MLCCIKQHLAVLKPLDFVEFTALKLTTQIRMRTKESSCVILMRDSQSDIEV